MRINRLTVKQFKSGIQQFETFYCQDVDFLRYSFSITYYHYCNSYFVNTGDHHRMKYDEKQFNTVTDAYDFLDSFLTEHNLTSKYIDQGN